MSRGKQGGSTGGMEYSPARSARRGAVRKRESRRWAALAGPVTVSQAEASAVDNFELKQPSTTSAVSCSAEPSEAIVPKGVGTAHD